MAFFFTCGTHTFTSPLAGYENVTARCQNCGNYSARVCKKWEWFTVCFVPILPFSLKPWHDVSCHICNFSQDLSYRQDITTNSASMPMQPQGGPPQGWSQPGQPGQYAMQQQPQYKPPGNQYG